MKAIIQDSNIGSVREMKAKEAKTIRKIRSECVYATRDENGHLTHVKDPVIGQKYIEFGMIAGG